MKRAVLLLAVFSASPIALGQLYTTVTLTGDRTQLSSTGHAEYRSGIAFTIDHDWFISITDTIDGPKSSSAGSTDWGTVTVNNGVLQPPPFLGSALPAGCYRATVSASAQVPNTINFVSQGAGSSQTCFSDPPPPDPPPTPDPLSGSLDAGAYDPIVISLSGPYRLSGPDDPVSFDITAGHGVRLCWTARDADIAFLALDRDANGQVDNGSELFGNGAPLRQGGRAQNGFEVLAENDANGDGVVDAADPVWSDLLLWTDVNHNGVSEPTELRHITASSITAIELQRHWTERRDQSGNWFGYEGHLREGKRVRSFYDVFFVTVP